MINTWGKGSVTQRRVIEAIMQEGIWKVVLFKSTHTRFGMKDFGPFDLVYAIGRLRLYVSCKTDPDNNFVFHKDEIRAWMARHARDGDEARLYIWREGAWRGRDPDKKWISPHLERVELGNLWEHVNHEPPQVATKV